MRAAAARAGGADAEWLRAAPTRWRGRGGADRAAAALDPELAAAMARHPDRARATDSTTVLAVMVEPRAGRLRRLVRDVPALRGAGEPGGTAPSPTATARLPYVAGDGLRRRSTCRRSTRSAARYRKGRNNTLEPQPGDPGSPWAIGAAEGGHKAVHPELGTLDDFDRLVAAAREHGLEIALDIAFQCSPDHPYVREHPEWFRHRPDGTIQYAENPPKKYQDIYPFDFECRRLGGAVGGAAARRPLLDRRTACAIFRVDNPHTKPFRVLGVADRARCSAQHPDVDLPRRGVHAAEGHAPPGQAAASRSRTPTSPGATRRRS